jgi:hypothetical protein
VFLQHVRFALSALVGVPRSAGFAGVLHLQIQLNKVLSVKNTHSGDEKVVDVILGNTSTTGRTEI